jgi:hypothetical protein
VILDAQETATITDRIASYNASIRAAAGTIGAAVVDTNGLLHQLATSGINVGGIQFTSAFLTGGVFSYDGVHPTAFGYAFVANAFIAAINAKFGAHIAPVDYSPFLFGLTPLPSPSISGSPQFSTAALESLGVIFRWPKPSAAPAPKPPKKNHGRPHKH